MNLEETKKELLELIKEIKEQKESLKKQIENESMYFNDILKKVEEIKKFEKDIFYIDKVKEDIEHNIKNFKSLYEFLETRTDNQEEELFNIVEKIQGVRSIKSNVLSTFKQEILKDKKFNNTPKKPFFDTVIKMTVGVVLIFSLYNSYKISQNKFAISGIVIN